MKRYIKILISLSLAAAFLISTSGVLVYLHHCDHRNATYTSLFFKFRHGDQPPCKQEPISCCDKHDDNLPLQCDPSCCSDIVLVLKYIPDTEPAQNNTLKIKQTDEPDNTFELTFTVFSESSFFQSVCQLPPEKPPISGRQKVILYNQLKEDPFFS